MVIKTETALAHLVARFNPPGPKRILALDGGGTRGIITLAILAKIEAELRAQLKKPDLVLADYFDLIGGTSVGALIGTMLATGHSVQEVEDVFRRAVTKIFKRRWWQFWRWLPIMARFDTRALTETVNEVVGAKTTLGSDKLKTGLVIVSKRIDTGSVWTMTNAPSYPYYPANKDYLLVDVLRASTAASSYFKPQKITVKSLSDPTKDIEGVFVDGAASPHNNPALLLFMMAGLKRFNFGGPAPYIEAEHASWKLGADKLLMVSVGTGGSPHTAGERWAAAADGIDALKSVMSDGHELVMTMMQWLSHSHAKEGWRANAVMRNLEHDVLGIEQGLAQPLVRFQRYDAPLDEEWLDKNLGMKFKPSVLRGLQDFTNPDDVATLSNVGREAADRQVRADHFPLAFVPDALRRVT